MLDIRGFIVTIACFISVATAQTLGQCLTLHNVDVTNKDHTLDSQDNFDGRTSTYDSNLRRCIFVYTNNTNHVIKLEEKYFLLENSEDCTLDYVALYDSSGFTNELGRYCHTEGPGTVYSSGSTLFIFFRTDGTMEYRGFRFILSSIHKDDVPTMFTTTSIAALAICVAIVVTIILICIFCVVKGSKKYPNTVHVMPRTETDTAYVYSLYSERYVTSRTPRSYILPKPPSYQDSINTSRRPGELLRTQHGQGARSGSIRPFGYLGSESSSAGQTLGRRQQLYDYETMNSPEYTLRPLSPPPAYQP